MTSLATKERSEGVIDANAGYTLRELARRAGLGHSSIRLARSKGLKIRRFGRKQFVLGSDFLKFLEGLGNEPEK